MFCLLFLVLFLALNCCFNLKQFSLLFDVYTHKKLPEGYLLILSFLFLFFSFFYQGSSFSYHVLWNEKITKFGTFSLYVEFIQLRIKHFLSLWFLVNLQNVSFVMFMHYWLALFTIFLLFLLIYIAHGMWILTRNYIFPSSFFCYTFLGYDFSHIFWRLIK